MYKLIKVVNGESVDSSYNFKNKIVYFGTTASSLFDIKTVPVSRIYPGVEVQATYVNNLIDNNLNNVIQYSAAKKQNLYIKLRALMQYFGTDICRNYIDNNIWINSTMSKVIDIAISRTLCIIPDVRFANEANAIRNNDKLLYGGLIKINRDNQDLDKHNSERINFDVDFEIDNNLSLIHI